MNLHDEIRIKEQLHNLKKQLAEREKQIVGLRSDNLILLAGAGKCKEQIEQYKKQIVMLREALEEASNILADNQLWGACTLCNKALAATNDLSGYILCDAEPIYQWRKRGEHERWYDAPKEFTYEREDEFYEARTLYKARKP